MGMDLEGAGGDFRWTSSGWSKTLESAEMAGWKPSGTGPPKGVLKADWAGGYYSNDGQRFYALDAKRLAQALEAVCAKEDHAMQEFIAFCRAGSFRLY